MKDNILLAFVFVPLGVLLATDFLIYFTETPTSYVHPENPCIERGVIFLADAQYIDPDCVAKAKVFSTNPSR